MAAEACQALVDDVPLYDIYIAARKSALLAVAVHLDIFSLFQTHKELTVPLIQTQYELSSRGADALLVGLATLGILTRLDRDNKVLEERYGISELAEQYLVPSAPNYFGNLVKLEWEDFITPQSLLAGMKSNHSQAYGVKDVWEAHQQDAEKTCQFTNSMHSISVKPAFSLVQSAKELFSFHCMLDVGGGSGVFTIAASLKHGVQGIIYEIPPVKPVVEKYISQYGCQEAISVSTGDMFTSPWPNQHPSGTNVDCVFFSQIFHDWSREDGKKLARKAYDLLDKGGRVIIHEKLLDDDRQGPVANAMVSLDMLFWTEGQQYSGKELVDLLAAVGFHSCQVVKNIGYWSAVTAIK